MAGRRAKATTKSEDAESVEVGVDALGGVKVKVPITAIEQAGKAGSWAGRQVEKIASWVAPDYAARVKLTAALAESTSAAIAAGAPLSAEQEFLLARALRREERAVTSQARTMALVTNCLPSVDQQMRGLPPSTKPTSEAFVRHAEAAAEIVNDAEIARIFARCLAGEACRPGTISVATLEVVKLLDPETAEAFNRLRTVAWLEHHGAQHQMSLVHGWVPSIEDGGMGPDDVFALIDARLLDGGHAFVKMSTPSATWQTDTMHIGGFHVRLAPVPGLVVAETQMQIFRVTRAGVDLNSVLEPVAPAPRLLRSFRQWSRNIGLLQVEQDGAWVSADDILRDGAIEGPTTRPSANPAPFPRA